MNIKVNQFLENASFGNFHKIICVLFFLIMSFDGFDMVIYSATLGTLQGYFQINSAQAGFLASYALIGAALGAIILGAAADRIGRKKVIILATLLFSLGTFAAGLSTGYVTFAVFRFITGLGLGGVMPNIVALTTEYSPRSKRAWMTALVFSGMQVGGILAAVCSMGMISTLGWRSVYYVGLFPLILIPFMIKFVPESAVHLYKAGNFDMLKKVLKRVGSVQKETESVTFQMDLEEKARVSALFKHNRASSTVFIWIVFFMNMYMIFGLSTWLPELMTMNGFGLGGGIVFLLTLNLGALIGSNVAGAVAGRIGYRKTLIGLYIIAFISIMLLSAHVGYAVEIILVALAGVGFYGGQNLTNAYVGLYYPPEMRSTAMGFAFGLGRLGAIFGPSISGILLAAGVPMIVNYMVLAIPGLVAAACIFAIREKYSYTKNQTGQSAQISPKPCHEGAHK